MEEEDARKDCAKRKAAALGASFIAEMINTSSTAAVICAYENMEQNDELQKPRGRYLRSGVLHNPRQSFWMRVWRMGDEMEFFHFMSMSRSAFNDLVDLLTSYILNHPQSRDHTKASKRTSSKRIFKPRDIVAMTIRYLASVAEYKDIQSQFGAVLSCLRDCIELGMSAILTLIDHPSCRVVWDRSLEHCTKAAERTNSFLDIEGVVGMLDGKKLLTLQPQDTLSQNRDYNGWTGDVNRNLVLLWDPYGKIIDAAVNTPGNFHDSRSTLWCDIYKHVRKLPDGFKIVCDSAFATGGNLEGKILKLKEDSLCCDEKSDHEKQLTHLCQCSECGNQVLVGTFRRLKTQLPTDNVKRATIMWCTILLHNWRTEKCDRNQIKTYFDYLQEMDSVD